MRHSLYLDRPNARFGLRKVKDKVINTLYDLYDRLFDKSYYTKKKIKEIGNQDNHISLTNSEGNPYDKYGYIGGGTREVRQKYFNIDKEFTDSVKSISKRYGLRPEVVASRLAEEGPIDRGINMYNGSRPDFNRGTLLSSPNVKMIGPTWGLDDIYTDLLKGNVQFTTQTPYDYYDIEFDNEKGRRTYSIESPQWWLGIEGNAAELKYHRDKFKQQFPKISDKDLDAAAAMSFNMGTTGAKNFYKENGYIPKRYYPYINVKRNGGRISLETL